MAEFSYINSEVVAYKERLGVSYVDLEAAEYKAILAKGSEVSLGIAREKTKLLLPITALLCFALGVLNYRFFNYILLSFIFAPSALVLFLGEQSGAIWFACLILALSGVYLRLKINGRAI